MVEHHLAAHLRGRADIVPEESNCNLIPIVLAAAGHRDVPPDDVPDLVKALQRHFAKFRGDCPSTPLLLLCGLADGADRIAARAALEAGVAVGAVLPFAADEYLKDFDEASQAEFAELLGQCAWSVVVTPDGITDPADPAQRDLCYAAVARYLCRHAQKLLALWDGHDNGKVGGTAYVVSNFRTGLSFDAHQEAVLTDFPDCGPVLHVWTRRLHPPDHFPSDRRPGEIQELPPCPNGFADQANTLAMDRFETERWQTIFRSIDTFNCMMTDCLATSPDKIRKSMDSLAGPRRPEDLTPREWRYCTLYAVADTLSFRAQRLRKLVFHGMIFSFMLAVSLELLYSGLFPKWPLLLAAMVCGGVTFLLNRISSRWLKLEETYFDYRALAEGLRVQYFWETAGISRSVADEFLRDQRDSLEWIRQSLLNLSLPCGSEASPVPKTRAGLEYVREMWLLDQRNYFLGDSETTPPRPGKYGNLMADERRLARRSLVFLRSMAFILPAALAWHIYIGASSSDNELKILQWLIVAYGLCLWFLPTTELYRKIMAYEETARNYLSTGLIFQACERRFSERLAAGDYEQARRLLLQLGRRALGENSTWLTTHRSRPLEPPL